MSEEEGPPETIEEIAEMYNLPLEAVNEAVAYCESNPPELLEDYAREDAIAEASGENDPNYKYNPKPKTLTPRRPPTHLRSMRLYLDDDMASALLVRLLRAAGHDVVVLELQRRRNIRK